MWVNQLLPLLKRALQKAALVPTEHVSELYARLATSEEEVILIQDATTRPIERSTDAQVQKEHYDGKHKMDTIKNHLVTQTDKKIVYVSPLYEGSVHDKKLIDEEQLTFPKQVGVIQDLGFQGFDPEECTVIMPQKKKRKQPLSNLDKALNQIIASCRIIVENVIGSVKVLRILKDKIRIRGMDKRQDVFLIGCALHNLKLKSKPLENNS